MKKILAILLIVALSVVPAFADPPYEIPHLSVYGERLLQNGTYLTPVPNAETVDEDGRLFVPLRVVLETGGFTVDYDSATHCAIIDKAVTLNLTEQRAGNTSYELYIEDGVTYVVREFFELFPELTLTWDAAAWCLVVDSTRDLSGVSSYNLGKRTMQTSLHRELNYDLVGSIKVPQTSNNPVVILLHGAHSIEKSIENRYDLGFSYLMHSLADQGFAVISMNVNMQYSFEDGEPIANERIREIFRQQIKALLAANQGEDVGFPLDLTNKLDFSNLVLVGHSRSGQEAFFLYEDLKNDFDISAKGILSIAPATLWDNDYKNIDVPVSILLPELDGDVITLEGQNIFDRLADNPQRTAPTQVVYLYGANHNAFNQSILKQDAGKNWYKGEVWRMEAEDQRIFAQEYIATMADCFINDQNIYEIGSENEMLGYKAMVSNFIPGTFLYHAKDRAQGAEGVDAQVKALRYSSIPAENEVGLFNHPGGLPSFELLNIRWDRSGAKAVFSGEGWDISQAETLGIYAAQDSTDPINSAAPLPFTVILVDKEGKSASYKIPSDSLFMQYHEGDVVDIFTWPFFTAHTPLGITNIPLSNFSDVDLANISRIELFFDQQDQGSIMLRFLYVQ